MANVSNQFSGHTVHQHNVAQYPSFPNRPPLNHVQTHTSFNNNTTMHMPSYFVLNHSLMLPSLAFNQFANYYGQHGGYGYSGSSDNVNLIITIIMEIIIQIMIEIIMSLQIMRLKSLMFATSNNIDLTDESNHSNV